MTLEVGRRRTGSEQAARAARRADVPPIARLLRWQHADVLYTTRIPRRRAGRLPRLDRRHAVLYGAAQFAYWQHTQLIIDVVPGHGSGFSLEAPEGVRFLTRSRVFDDAESDMLEAAGPPPDG
jgi:hypothetical protein